MPERSIASATASDGTSPGVTIAAAAGDGAAARPRSRRRRARRGDRWRRPPARNRPARPARPPRPGAAASAKSAASRAGRCRIGGRCRQRLQGTLRVALRRVSRRRRSQRDPGNARARRPARLLCDHAAVPVSRGTAQQRGDDRGRQDAEGRRPARLRRRHRRLAAVPPPAPATPPDPARMAKARELARQHKCVFCHGDDLSGGQQVPRIGGQREEYLRETLRGFKSGQRPATRRRWAKR